MRSKSKIASRSIDWGHQQLSNADHVRIAEKSGESLPPWQIELHVYVDISAMKGYRETDAGI
jgi:hypothetical protein